MVLAVVAKGIEFEPITLGLQPGATTSEINFNWYSATTDGNQSIVRILKNNKIVATKTGTSNNASSGNRWHKVTVGNLEPNTQYTYQVSNNGTDWSKEYSYKTPPTGNFKFALVADPQVTTGSQDAASLYFSSPATTAAGWAETVSKIAATGASFIVSNGDQVDALNGNESEYNNLFAPKQLKNIPFAPVMGNHDRHCHFFYHFNLPNQASNVPACASGDLDNMSNYYYLYNRVLFIGLNTSPYPTNTAAAATYISKYRNTIQAAKTAYAGQYDWIIVYHHKSTASVASHIGDADLKQYVGAGFQTMMSKEGINLVVAGHDHIYARSNLMDGVLYLTLNTAGGLKYYPANKYLPQTNEKYFASYKPEYTIIDVTNSTFTISTYTIDNTVTPHDQFIIAK
jgi:hypothetical protein